GFSAAPFVASKVACRFSIAAPYPSISASLSWRRKSAVTGQQTSLQFPLLSWVEGILTYSPFSPEQIRKPSILKQPPMVTLAYASRFRIGAIGQTRTSSWKGRSPFVSGTVGFAAVLLLLIKCLLYFLKHTSVCIENRFG